MAHTLTSNGALLVLMKLALDKAQHQAGLAYGRLSKQDQLKLAYFVADGGGTVGPRWSTSPRHANRPDTVGLTGSERVEGPEPGSTELRGRQDDEGEKRERIRLKKGKDEKDEEMTPAG